MSKTIKVGIVGYGNVGKGVELAVGQSEDMSLEVIITRRDPGAITPLSQETKVVSIAGAEELARAIDVMILCGGSATDLAEQGPYFAARFNVVDSYDTHARIPAYFTAVDEAAREGGKVAVISTGWDPGLFSVMRVLCQAFLPRGAVHTFWGPGISQGHSDAVRRIKGVKDARQYTLPVEAALAAVRSGGNPALDTRAKHTRLCFVVLEEDSAGERSRVEAEIKDMPNYFADYDTTVRFVTEQELHAEHAKMPHGGVVLSSGESGAKSKQLMELSLKLESNPEFTGNVLVAYARAAHRLAREGARGARTVFDIAPGYLAAASAEELRRTML